MFVSKLRVYNFRNLADQTISLNDGPVYITGLNGNGKTNLVEALYLLSGSRSFRTNSQSDLVKWGARESSVFGTIVRKDGNDEIGVALSPGQRTAFKNGNQLSSIAELVGSCGVVAFTPADLSLVKGPPVGRRKFLDRHIVDLDPGFLNTLLTYQRALASKSALLKNHGIGIEQLRPWNELLTDGGGKIVEKRAKFLNILQEKARSNQREFAETDGPLSLSLESDFIGKDGQFSRERVEQEFERVASRELALRSTLFGVHRDDIAISLGEGVDARAFASQGQTRSLVLALTLGVIEMVEDKLGESPIVVLDDVDSELDAPRAKRLFAALGRRSRQLIITGTATPPEELVQGVHQKVQVVRIQAGTVLSS